MKRTCLYLRSVLLALILGLFASVRPAAAQAFDEDEDAPDIMEVLRHDSSFLAEFSAKLQVSLDSSCNPRLVATVADWLGVPYRHAGFSKDGIDCSGFVSMMYKEIFNYDLTHSSSAMIFEMKEMVKKDEMVAGDIIFFRIHGRRISHVGMYLGQGKFVHASSGRGIVVDDINAPYYKRAYYSAGRPIPLAPPL